MVLSSSSPRWSQGQGGRPGVCDRLLREPTPYSHTAGGRQKACSDSCLNRLPLITFSDLLRSVPLEFYPQQQFHNNRTFDNSSYQMIMLRNPSSLLCPLSVDLKSLG